MRNPIAITGQRESDGVCVGIQLLWIRRWAARAPAASGPGTCRSCAWLWYLCGLPMPVGSQLQMSLLCELSFVRAVHVRTRTRPRSRPASTPRPARRGRPVLTEISSSTKLIIVITWSTEDYRPRRWPVICACKPPLRCKRWRRSPTVIVMRRAGGIATHMQSSKSMHAAVHVNVRTFSARLLFPGEPGHAAEHLPHCGGRRARPG